MPATYREAPSTVDYVSIPVDGFGNVGSTDAWRSCRLRAARLGSIRIACDLDYTSRVTAARAMLPFFALFPHMNLRIELGPLTSVFLGPQVHRIHHSANSADFNTNFAGAFPVWDIFFGTYRAAKRGEFPQTGLPAMNAIPGPAQMLLWPVQHKVVGVVISKSMVTLNSVFQSTGVVNQREGTLTEGREALAQS
jgi:Fatty acid hydroxylase superfamily